MTRRSGPVLVEETIDHLPSVSIEDRRRVSDRIGTHADWLEAFRCLHLIEAPGHPVSSQDAPSSSLRIAAWNVERLKHVEEVAEVVRAANADVVLLSEVDVGCARSGQRHTVSELAGELGYGYAFGVEFVEAGLGDIRERTAHAGETNAEGLHGNAILSRYPLQRVAMARLDTDGAWFDDPDGLRGDQPRVGGRMALLAQVEGPSGTLTVVSVHLESHTDPRHRAEQFERLLDMIDSYDAFSPVLIGGDLNTSSLSVPGTTHEERRATVLAEPARLSDPAPWEPLFALAAARRYTVDGCNVPGAATQRSRPDGTPQPPFSKLDWFLSRGLTTAAPAVLEALSQDGTILSDHEALFVSVR